MATPFCRDSIHHRASETPRSAKRRLRNPTAYTSPSRHRCYTSPAAHWALPQRLWDCPLLQRPNSAFDSVPRVACKPRTPRNGTPGLGARADGRRWEHCRRSNRDRLSLYYLLARYPPGGSLCVSRSAPNAIAVLGATHDLTRTAGDALRADKSISGMGLGRAVGTSRRASRPSRVRVATGRFYPGGASLPGEFLRMARVQSWAERILEPLLFTSILRLRSLLRCRRLSKRA